MTANQILHIPGTTLGEGPVWDSRTQLLWWVDIKGHMLHAFDPEKEENTSYEIGQYIGAAVPCESSPDKFVVGLHHGLGFFYPKSGRLDIKNDPESDLPLNRFNDGKCDPVGRFWTGTMNLEPPREATGNLYCVDENLSAKKELGEIYVSNGLAWSQDATKMYYIDSNRQSVRVFDYEIDTGAIKNEQIALQFEGKNFPDGMCIDKHDNLWVAFYGKGKVCCYNPKSGQQLEQIDVPAKRTTSCCFAGPDLDTLYITTASMEGDPQGGALFVAKPGVQGCETNFFKDN